MATAMGWRSYWNELDVAYCIVRDVCMDFLDFGGVLMIYHVRRRIAINEDIMITHVVHVAAELKVKPPKMDMVSKIL